MTADNRLTKIVKMDSFMKFNNNGSNYLKY